MAHSRGKMAWVQGDWGAVSSGDQPSWPTDGVSSRIWDSQGETRKVLGKPG